MDNLKHLIWNINHKIDDIKDYFFHKKMKRLYPDYENDEYNCGEHKHIWGIKSFDDLSGNDCSFYTMNDIDISYDRKNKDYCLSIETAYMFENKESECKYLRDLLNAFTYFMDANGYSKDFKFLFFMSSPPELNTRAKQISDLYLNFKIFVEGYCKVCGFDESKVSY